MSKTTKGDWNPGPKYTAYLEKIREVLNNDEQRTVRDVYYALEARGFPTELAEQSYRHQLHKHRNDPEEAPHPDNMPESDWLWEFEYRFVKRAVKRGRRAGYIDPSQIVDASRAAEARAATGWDSPKEFVTDRVDGIWNEYWENFWADQDTYLEIWLEKQSLASVFQPICNQYNVRLEATRGDWSDSKVYEACQRLIPKLNEGKDIKILYFGDYNPSGFHSPVSILDAMGYYGINLHREFPGSDDSRYYDVMHGLPAFFEASNVDDPDVHGSFNVERLALTTEQIEKFDLPENPVPSSTDKDETIKQQFQTHVSNGRDVNVELNALKEYHRDFLETLIEEAITTYIDDDGKTATENRIRQHRSTLRNCISIDYESVPGLTASDSQSTEETDESE